MLSRLRSGKKESGVFSTSRAAGIASTLALSLKIHFVKRLIGPSSGSYLKSLGAFLKLLISYHFPPQKGVYSVGLSTDTIPWIDHCVCFPAIVL